MPNLSKNFKKHHATLISIMALVFSGISLLVSIRGCRLTERVEHQHIVPNIEVSYVQSKEWDQIVFRNRSPIDIGPIYVNYKAYGFDKEKDKWRIAIWSNKSIIDDPGERWIDIPKLEPNQPHSEHLGELTSGYESPQSKLIVARVFEIEFYRPSDMTKFEKREIFFVDGGTVYKYEEASKLNDFRKPVRELEPFIREHSNDAAPMGYKIKQA